MVIGIIAILLAILVPTLGRVRAEANATACKANLRELFIAQQLYARDNRGRFTPITAESSDRWERKLGRYLGRREAEDAPPRLMHCPVPAANGQVTTSMLSSYGLNSWIMAPAWRMRATTARLPASRIILMGDKSLQADPHLTTEDGNFLIFHEVSGLLVKNPSHSHASTYRHGTRPGRGKANMVMADGHVDSYLPGELNSDSGRWYWAGLPDDTRVIKAIQTGCCP